MRLLLIILAYSALTWFAGQQRARLIDVRNGEPDARPLLSLLMTVTSSAPIRVGFLLWLGYATRWYYPLAVAASSFFVRPTLFVSAEVMLGWPSDAPLIAILGLAAIPLLALAMVQIALAS